MDVCVCVRVYSFHMTNQIALILKHILLQNAVGGREEDGEGEGQEVGVEVLDEIRVSLHCRSGAEVYLAAETEFGPGE